MYLHNGDNSFVPFARYSSNPNFSKPGRTLYPANAGCICRGWEDKWHFRTFENDAEMTMLSCDEYGMDQDVVDTLKMRSLLFAVARIDNNDREPIGVLVVESMDNSKYTERQIRNILYEHKEYLWEMISVLIGFIPTPRDASTIEED